MAIRIFIIDDHALVRSGIRLIVSGQPDMEVIGEASSGDAALPQVRSLKPDIVLCDLHMPGMSGLEITERIVRGQQDVRVIMVSVLEDGPMPRRLLEAGASGYVGKGGDAEELLEAIREVSRGRRFLAGNVARHMALAGIDGDGNPFDLLSDRELEVALMLAQGLRQGQIAERLSLSPKTVNTHKSRLFEKLAIADTVALARLMGQHGLIEETAAP